MHLNFALIFWEIPISVGEFLQIISMIAGFLCGLGDCHPDLFNAKIVAC